MKLAFGGSDHKLDEALAMWVMKRAGFQRPLHQGEYYAIGVVNNKNTLIAGVMYHNYHKMGAGGTIELSMAADDPGWCRKGIICGLLHYPFMQLNCHLIISTVGRRNKRVRRLAEKIGYKEVGVIPNWPVAEDLVVLTLKREDAAKWFPPQVKQKEAA